MSPDKKDEIYLFKFRKYWLGTSQYLYVISIFIHQYNHDLLSLVAHVTLILQNDLDDVVTFPFHQYNYDLLNLVAHVTLIRQMDPDR